VRQNLMLILGILALMGYLALAASGHGILILKGKDTSAFSPGTKCTYLSWFGFTTRDTANLPFTENLDECPWFVENRHLGGSRL